MNPKLRNQFLDSAVIFGLVAAATMSIGMAATLGVILSIIFGGSSFWWAIGTIAVDLGVSVWLVTKIVRGFWDEIERTNMP